MTERILREIDLIKMEIEYLWRVRLNTVPPTKSEVELMLQEKKKYEGGYEKDS